MLVLTRKRDELIRIGSNIVIRVIKTSGGSVKLGIEAPASVRVLRGELATVEHFETDDQFIHIDESMLEDCMPEALFMQS